VAAGADAFDWGEPVEEDGAVVAGPCRALKKVWKIKLPCVMNTQGNLYLWLVVC
jgi:hypothetical protein